MAFERLQPETALPLSCSSDIGAHAPVTLDVAGGPLGIVRQARLCATTTDEPIAVTIEGALQGRAIPAYQRGNVVKAVAAATIGYGSDVGVATVIPAIATVYGATAGTPNIAGLGPAAGASGSRVWAVGKALESANPGEVFSLYVNPKQLSTPAGVL